MKNQYIENLAEKMRNSEVTGGERNLVWAYSRSVREGFKVITVSDCLFEKDVESFVAALHIAGVSEIYITSQSSNMLGVYLMLDELGLKLRGVVRLENPAYARDIERWSRSIEETTIPAMWFSFSEQ